MTKFIYVLHTDIVELNFAVTHLNWSQIEYDIRALDVRYKDILYIDTHFIYFLDNLILI